MKIITLMLIICFCAQHFLHAQIMKDSIPADRVRYNELSKKYFEKGKGLETAGFLLAGLGMAAAIGGFYGTLNNYDLFTGEGSGYLILWLVGVGAVSAGVPTMTVGFHYKRKAKLVLRNDNIGRIYHVPIKSNIMSFGIAFTIK